MPTLGARNKFGAPACLNLRSFGSKCTVLIKVLAILLGLFGALSVSAPGHCAPLSPSLRPWFDNRSRIMEQNVKALITCKIKTDVSCCGFHENKKSKKDFMKKVLSTETYYWANV